MKNVSSKYWNFSSFTSSRGAHLLVYAGFFFPQQIVFCGQLNAAGNAYFSFPIPCVEEAAASVVTYPHPGLHGESNLPLERASTALFIVSLLPSISDMTSQQSGIIFRGSLGLTTALLLKFCLFRVHAHSVHP